MSTPSRKYLLLISVPIALIALALYVRLAPLPVGFLDEKKFVSRMVLDRNGERLYESLSPAGNRSEWIRANTIPPAVMHATLAAEDHRFFRHPGIDPLALGRALYRDLRAGGFVEGGSTLTQQAVKQILLTGQRGETSRRGVGSKVREAILALRLEHNLSKKEILALYLNLAPYGNQYVGIERASRGYFGVPPSNLTHAQAAFLAGLPQRPARFDPYRNREPALARQKRILARMQATGFISSESVTIAERERLSFVRNPRSLLAPHFVERVLEDHPTAARLETTLDGALQREVQGIIQANRPLLERHGAHNVAVVVLDNQTGEWLAWEGSGDYFDEQHGGAIDGAISPRQPGSALKPFTYALAFENRYSPASVLPDIQTHFPTAVAGILYSPRNYDGQYRGPMKARYALAGSENMPAVALLSELGTPSLLRLLRECGFSTFDKTAGTYGLGLTLGDGEVRLDELVAAYAAFARGGILVRPRMLREKTHEEGRRMFSPRTAFWITDILSDARAREYAFGSGGSLDFHFPVAAKTGTSQAYRDNWAIGYTREVTVGVWVGNFDRTELKHSSGITGAGPIFHAVMLAAQKRAAGYESNRTILDAPPDVTHISICALSGLQPSEHCPATEREWIGIDQPRVICHWHSKGGAVSWPAQYRQWARERGLVQSESVVQARHTLREPSRKSMKITNPPPGAVYLIDPTLRSSFQTIPLKVTAEGPARRVKWSVDGRSIGSCHSDQSLPWPLDRGEHSLRASDEHGHSDETRIVVR